MYIIHNLMNFQTKKQVEDHIKNTVLKSASFNIEKMKYADDQKKKLMRRKMKIKIKMKIKMEIIIKIILKKLKIFI